MGGFIVGGGGREGGEGREGGDRHGGRSLQILQSRVNIASL